MSDQITNEIKASKNRTGDIARKAFLWITLGLALFTFFRMASKKFGWF